jgi:OmpA-OmpF porin, OOP family
MTKKVFAALGFAAATAFAGSALAQESAWYLGGSIGQSKAKDACSDLSSNVSCDDKDTAWKIFGGYQFNRYIAAEVAYTDLGKVKASGPTVSAEVKSNAWELVGVGSYPIGASGFAPYAKLGVYRGESKLSSSSGVSDKDTSNDWTAGLGVRYDITKNVAVRAEWQRYNGDADIDMLSIGALYKF